MQLSNTVSASTLQRCRPDHGSEIQAALQEIKSEYAREVNNFICLDTVLLHPRWWCQTERIFQETITRVHF